jgi:hypothetical protein
MNLPNYFLADLPSDASLTSTMVAEACQALKRNRRQYLASRPTQDLVGLLSHVAQAWLKPDSPFRKMALAGAVEETGFSSATLARGLDGFFKQLTADNLHQLMEQDLGHARRLDEFVSGAGEQGRNAVAIGPELVAHFAAGNLPVPALQSIVLGLVTRSSQFVKCATGASFIPRLFAHAIYEADRKLASCLEIAHWRGGDTNLEKTLLDEADCVTATGNDETIAALRQRIPESKRFVGYGQRYSFGFVCGSVLGGGNARNVAAAAAIDVAAWNQLGCLSPHVVYVEHGGSVAAEQFAALVAEELERLEASEPRGELPVEISAAIASRRSVYEIRAACSARDHEAPLTKLWQSKGSTAWTVVYESDPRFQPSCLHRFIYVKGVAELREALQAADAVRNKISTVGLAAPPEKVKELARELGAWGALRICALGQMQNPPLTWRHDGRPALGELVRWVDLEIH